jgi:DNA-binding NarL/FixJ family response regulator
LVARDQERPGLTPPAWALDQAISERMLLSAKTVERHVRNIFTKLNLSSAPDDHRRVLAVLTFLRS